MDVTINEKQYAWGDIDVMLLGKRVTGLRGINYTEDPDNQAIYARGKKPISIQSGNIKYEGEITILQSELEALIRAAGKGKSIASLPQINIVVSYVPEEGLPIITDVVEGAKLGKVTKGMKQGDVSMEVTIPFIALNIDYDV